MNSIKHSSFDYYNNKVNIGSDAAGTSLKGIFLLKLRYIGNLHIIN